MACVRLSWIHFSKFAKRYCNSWATNAFAGLILILALFSQTLCPKHCFVHVFLLTSISGLCEKRGNTRIFGCWPVIKRCKLHWFLALQWLKQRHWQGFNVWPCALVCSLMGSQGKLGLDVVKTPLFTRFCHFSHPRAPGFPNFFMALASTWPPQAFLKFKTFVFKMKLSTLAYGAIKVRWQWSKQQWVKSPWMNNRGRWDAGFRYPLLRCWFMAFPIPGWKVLKNRALRVRGYSETGGSSLGTRFYLRHLLPVWKEPKGPSGIMDQQWLTISWGDYLTNSDRLYILIIFGQPLLEWNPPRIYKIV